MKKALVPTILLAVTLFLVAAMFAGSAPVFADTGQGNTPGLSGAQDHLSSGHAQNTQAIIVNTNTASVGQPMTSVNNGQEKSPGAMANVVNSSIQYRNTSGNTQGLARYTGNAPMVSFDSITINSTAKQEENDVSTGIQNSNKETATLFRHTGNAPIQMNNAGYWLVNSLSLGNTFTSGRFSGAAPMFTLWPVKAAPAENTPKL